MSCLEVVDIFFANGNINILAQKLQKDAMIQAGELRCDSGGGINIDDIINGGADFGDKILNMGGNVIDDATNKLNQISNPEDWVLGLHQVLLFFLVIGRWMLPRGGIR